MPFSGLCALPVTDKTLERGNTDPGELVIWITWGIIRLPLVLSLLSSFLTYCNSETKLLYQPVSDKFSANL